MLLRVYIWGCNHRCSWLSAFCMVTTQLYHDIAAYRALPLNGYEKVTIINAVLIPRWTYRGLFLGNRSRMAVWDDILLQYLRDTPGIEQRMNKHRLTTNLSHGDRPAPAMVVLHHLVDHTRTARTTKQRPHTTTHGNPI